MNDFTKDELEILRDFCANAESQYTKNKPYNYLADRIQSMIDNHCEHEWDELLSCIRCRKCGYSERID